LVRLDLEVFELLHDGQFEEEERAGDTDRVHVVELEHVAEFVFFERADERHEGARALDDEVFVGEHQVAHAPLELGDHAVGQVAALGVLELADLRLVSVCLPLSRPGTRCTAPRSAAR
jgi:hypothetical protein